MSKLLHPTPAPPNFANGEVNPEVSANIWSRLWLNFVFPLLRVGYSRPLEDNDLWLVDEKRRANGLGDLIERNYARRKEAKALKLSRKPAKPASDDPEAGNTSAKSTPKPKKVDNSWELIWAVYDSFTFQFWMQGLLKFVGDTAGVTSPLVSQELLRYLTFAYLHHQSPETHPAPRSAAYGYGLAVLLFFMQIVENFASTQFHMLAFNTGVLFRTGTSSALFRKSLRLSNKSRLEYSKGRITTMLSEDAVRLERMYFWFHNMWLAPIQIIVAIALLIRLLGYSAVVGLGVIIISFPIQSWLVSAFFKAIRKNIFITDQRVKLMQEVLQGIRSIKMYSWERFYGHKISEFRQREISQIRKSATSMSGLFGFTALIPMLSSTLSFVTYSLTGHPLNPDKIFAALQLLNIIRFPLIMFPAGISMLAQARLAIIRMSEFLDAEEAPPHFDIHKDGDVAIDIDDANFAWEEEQEESGAKTAKSSKEKKEEKKEKQKEKAEEKKKSGLGFFARLMGKKAPVEEEKDKEKDKEKQKSEPFELRNVKMQIKRGEFVAIVGRVASGKTSLLQALVGEMRKTRGDVTLGGSVAYVPQTPWIINATVENNIIFGEPVDAVRYHDVIRTCSLQQDLDVLQYGDQTEIGEKGINLSGGQRARVSLARAAYSQADIVLLDDPISALDAHVGKAVIENCILNGPLSERTRVLVTHALHVLPHADYVYVLDQGQIVEHGQYEELLASKGELARLIDEFGSKEVQTQSKRRRAGTVVGGDDEEDEKDKGLMQAEERVTGSVPLKTYRKYFTVAGGARWWIPWLFAILVLNQSAQVASTLFLGFWTSRSIPGLKNGHYIGIYIGVGILQAFFQMVGSFSWAIVALRASYALFELGMNGVMGSPIAFFDTTPMGRIVSRLTKDVAALDSNMWQLFDSFFNSAFSVFGTIGLVFYTFPYLGILFAPMLFIYYFFLAFYRRNSVELKRLDSILRSNLYSSYIETMNGISTVRATRSEGRFVLKTEAAMDSQNRASLALWWVVGWLSIRLTMCGNILVLGIGLFGVGQRTSVDPSKVGVVLTYTMSVIFILTDIVTSFAAMEQGMNSAERMITYGDLEREGGSIPDQKPAPPNWPNAGGMEFKNVTMAYRPELPDVLHSVSFTVKPGEKVGIVGRTGAGKSSLTQAILRLVEIRDGAIEVDGVNTQRLTLQALREGVSIIPQDSLFLGSLRENIDPLKTRTDAELLAILQRAHLLPGPGVSDPTAETRFTLDASLGQEGVGLSAGERQQLALCRVLVKQSKIVILDEATSSVDVETDSKLQATIRSDLASSTLLCIAHRLNTIAGYDRILVMDHGRVAEFDTPLVLFDKNNSIFRGLCDEAGLSRDDIMKIRQGTDSEGRI